MDSSEDEVGPNVDAHSEQRVLPASELSELIDASDGLRCAEWLEATAPRDAVYALSHLSDEQREHLLALISPEAAAGVVDQLPEPQAVDALSELDAPTAARILDELPSDERVDLIGELDATDADAILDELDPLAAADVRRLSGYDDATAGGLMRLELLAYPSSSTVRQVLDDLDEHSERYANFDIQYTYAVDPAGHLEGVVPLRALLLAPRSKALREIMHREPVVVRDETALEELSAVFRETPYLGLPVVDAGGMLLGVVERRGVQDAEVEDAEEQYRHTQGIVGGEELRSMPLFVRSSRRLGWLSINIVLNLLAASIIALHQDTLEAVIALAVFLPIISDMSGCSGNQAVAVSMRELTLGVTRPRDLVAVLAKELSVGLVNGIALGLLIGFVAFAWKGNFALGAVVGTALALNTLVAVCIGGAIPLLLRRLDLDPALASGPVLTTVTDMCGFLLVLTLAAGAMTQLQVL